MAKQKIEELEGSEEYLYPFVPEIPQDIVYVAPEAHRVKDLRRVMPGSIVGYDVTLCSNCKGRIDTGGKRDKFCRHCGYRLEDDYNG